MTNLCCEVINALSGRTLATAESCTGGGIGAAITAVSGCSAVYRGGIVSYCNDIKHSLLDVPEELLVKYGAVSAPVAEAMAVGARKALSSDVAVSATGLAGPTGDEFGNPVGLVFIGYADRETVTHRKCFFEGSREEVRQQAIAAALELILVNAISREEKH